MAASLSAVELNYLIFRYFQESGLTHSAFVFGSEVSIDKISSFDTNLVPPAALVTLVQKGLLYTELEANNDELDVADDDFSFLQPLDLITKDVDQLRKIIRDRKKNIEKEKGERKEKHKGSEQQYEGGRNTLLKRKGRDMKR